MIPVVFVSIIQSISSSNGSFGFVSLDQRALGMSMRVERASLEQVHGLQVFHFMVEQWKLDKDKQ